MAHRIVHLACLISLLALTSANNEQSRWSRQLSTYTSDISDWIPLRGPIERESEISQTPVKRQAIAEPRILTEPFPGIQRPSGFSPDGFSTRNYFNTPANRHLYLQSVPSVPSAPQNYLTDQGFGQNIRFGLTHQNFPLTQGFVSPPFGFENHPPPPKPVRQPLTMNQVTFPHPSGVIPAQGKPFINQAQKSNLDGSKFVDGYRAENTSNEFAFTKKPQSLQKIKFDNVERPIGDSMPQHSKSEREEEVQLLYVPLQQLNRQHFNYRRPMTAPQLLNTDPFGQSLPRPNSGKPVFFDEYQKPGLKALDSFPGANYVADFNAQFKEADQVSQFTTMTTPFATYAPVTVKPKKLKPHQPPLAIFVIKDVNKNSHVKVGDVLSTLKNAETIAVLDSVNPLNAPKVFIGPSNLPPPDNFIKFELPYLSNIDHSDSKIKQLPFFVAPLSYNTPNGFAKIPFPSPHVGSVVINSQIKENVQSSSQASQHSQPFNPKYNVVTPPPHKEPPTHKPTFSYYSTATPNTKPLQNYQSNFYSFEPQTVSTLRPPSQPLIQTVPPIRPPSQPQIQTIPPIRPPSHSHAQTISPARAPSQPETQTAPPKTGSFFHSNPVSQHNPQNYPTIYQTQNNFKSSEAQYNFQRQPDFTTTLRTTTTSTTSKPPSTYPSQLLETHNPYSINQAFHFSTPLDYHSYFDDVKQPYVTPGQSQSPPISTPASTPNIEPRPEQVATDKPIYRQQSTPSYLNNYSPEIHYDSDQNKYPVYNSNEQSSKTKVTSQQTQSNNDNIPVYKYDTNSDALNNNNKYNTNIDVAVPGFNNYNIYNNKYETNVDTNANSYKIDSSADNYNTSGEVQGENYNNQYQQTADFTSSVEPEHHSDNNVPAVEVNTQQKYNEYNTYSSSEDADVSSPTSTLTTTTSTRRTPLRTRGRPRYTTTPRSDSYESTARVVVTRRPLRERKPLPTRPRYEPNKISTEKPIRKPTDSSESTTKLSRLRTRGRIHYKPTDSEEYDRKRTHNTKEEDLAYQRDVLHQNYPVTLMERTSTADIEAMTEPTIRQSSAKLESVTETVDTENAYTNEKVSISEQDDVKNETPLSTYTAKSTLQTETPYVPNVPSTHNEEYYYQSRSSIAPVEASAYDETDNDKEEDIYTKQTTPVPKPSKSETVAYSSEISDTEQTLPNYSTYNEYATVKQEDATTTLEVQDTKAASLENNESQETEEEESIVQTTPSYNRVRVRPGVIRQYHQASSAESSRNKEQRRRPAQPVTYRPATDRRRTTMRIDEIEADLKTKQVHSRYEQEYKHPVYKPEPSTEPVVASSTTTESTTKRGHFRRRRPSYSYTTTSTEAASTKRIYEVKNRFRGRRPTEKPTEKPDSQTEATTSTTRTSLHNRYSHRPRLSERYNKKPEPEPEVDDQDSNSSINRPKYVEPNTDQWSPKISVDSFKPYNPNDIVDEYKVATTERRSDKESELDIITARNEYEDILLTVTPATNNRMVKKIPDIPPTLEAIVEQSKVTKSDSSDSMSTFETMLEEVMKNLEEQDQDEYTIENVMKHKGGEIGEIPPERIISSGEGYASKSTTPMEETTTEPVTADDSPLEDEDEQLLSSRRRGFWKKVKVRPAPGEAIEFAESQYYTNTVNRLGQPINMKTMHDKSEKGEKPKVTTYKPKLELKDLFPTADDASNIDVISTLDIHKINSTKTSDEDETLFNEESKRTTASVEKGTETYSPGDLDLGTGSPDPTIDDLYLITPTEPTPTKPAEKDETFSFIDYLFGVSSHDNEKETEEENKASSTTQAEIHTTEQPKPKIVTTESGYIPEEITASSVSDEATTMPEFADIIKIKTTEESRTDKPTEDTTVSVHENSSVSSFMNPANVVSTSMSTEISHETEICFRGKCIKTNKDIL